MKKSLPPSRYLKLPEAAARCGVHPVTLRKAVAAGEVRGMQRGKGAHWSFLAEDVDRWMAGKPPLEDEIAS